MKLNSIQTKIISLVVIVLFLIISSVVYISVNNQKNNLLNSVKDTLVLLTDFLNITLKNIMLNGQAPVAINTMTDLKTISDLSEIDIYRTDGDVAFFDYKTLDYVNSYQKKHIFQKTERVNRKMSDDPNFKKVLEKEQPIIHELSSATNDPSGKKIRIQEMEYFFPIRNIQECWECHGTAAESGSLRGIAHFKVSLGSVYYKIKWASIIIIVMLLIAGLTAVLLILIMLHNMVLKPLLKIGNTVKNFGEGNLDIKVEIKNKDELGDLSQKINGMFKDVKERINLSKYVSKSTDMLVKQGISHNDHVERKNIAVLFSDIRGFTSYAEKSDPDEVIKNLNLILQVQADIVEKNGGDIDKFVGDELMAIFDDEYTAVKCAYQMILEVANINKEKKFDLYVGIGINCGEVIAGHIGSKNRAEFAVIGDTVNLASRLCSLAKKSMLLISEDVYKKVHTRVDARLIPDQRIKGKDKSVDFYVVAGVK